MVLAVNSVYFTQNRITLDHLMLGASHSIGALTFQKTALFTCSRSLKITQTILNKYIANNSEKNSEIFGVAGLLHFALAIIRLVGQTRFLFLWVELRYSEGQSMAGWFFA